MSVLTDRMEVLLGKGYFPVQLPPPFNTESLGASAAALNAAFAQNKTLQTECETFSVARGGHRRRTTKLPNPLSQFLLTREIATNWTGISDHLKKSKLSLSKPKLVLRRGDRAVEIPSLGELESERVLRSSGYRYALVSDVTQFFPSLYTHSLPWALHTKSAAKTAARNRRSAGFGDSLDKHARNCQSQQTIGIPIGPDTSHILAEIVAVGVDLEIKDSLKAWPPGYRYVDDFVLFFSTKAEADSALSYLDRALSHFELRLNEHKTRIVSIDSLEVDSWVHQLRHFEFSHKKSRQAQELNHFFQLAFMYASENPSESVMKFALRRVAVEFVRRDNWQLFESYLFRVAQVYPDTLQLVSQFLYTYKKAGYSISAAPLRRTIESLLQEHVPYSHHSEIAWALWMAIDNNIRISSRFVTPIVHVRSSVCGLLLMHLVSLNLVSGRFSPAGLRARCDAASLIGGDWLFAYQAEKDGLFPGVSPYVVAHQDFNVLLSNGVSFYDKQKTQKPLFEPKLEPVNPFNPEVERGLALPELFDYEDDPTEWLEFFDIAEEYIDW